MLQLPVLYYLFPHHLVVQLLRVIRCEVGEVVVSDIDVHVLIILL